jgi:integrase
MLFLQRRRRIPDPSDSVTLPRDRRREAAMTLPTTDQVAALLAAAEGPFRAYVALSAFAGLRLGEAAAVQVGDVDFLARPSTRRTPAGPAGTGRGSGDPGAKVRQRAGRV